MLEPMLQLQLQWDQRATSCFLFVFYRNINDNVMQQKLAHIGNKKGPFTRLYNDPNKFKQVSGNGT